MKLLQYSSSSVVRMTMPLRMLMLLLLVVICLVEPLTAFLPTKGTGRYRTDDSTTFVLQDSFQEDRESSSSSTSGSGGEIEEARRMLERLALNSTTGTLTTTTTMTSPDTTSTTTPLPWTTQMERLRRTELELLQALGDSDAAIDPLIELWVKEDGGRSSKVLHELMQQETCQDLVQEEAILRELVTQQQAQAQSQAQAQASQVVWVEPHARLAVLLFAKQEYQECMELCDFVLGQKPWHFEMAHLFRVALLRVGNVRFALQVTRDLCLPPLLQQPKRRAKWIATMVGHAQAKLNMSSRAAAQINDAIDVAIDSEECDLDNPNRACWQ